jgi:hypothetical protein
MQEKRDTVGKIITDLQKKAPESFNVVELERGMQENYMKELLDCVDQSCSLYEKEFYIVVLTKMERLSEKLLRNYFFARKSCPTPDYDQSVYKYNKESGKLDYLWTIPSKDACEHLAMHATEVVQSERMLLGFVMSFLNGKLLEYSKKINGEEKDSNILIK